MATPERIEQLRQFVRQWEESLVGAEKQRDEYIDHQKSGLFIFTSDSDQDLLPTLIQEADNAAKIYQKCLIRLQSVLNRALAGEDV